MAPRGAAHVGDEVRALGLPLLGSARLLGDDDAAAKPRERDHVAIGLLVFGLRIEQPGELRLDRESRTEYVCVGHQQPPLRNCPSSQLDGPYGLDFLADQFGRSQAASPD